MAPKIFITGATGYIGGTALDLIIKTHPEYEITALVRDEHKEAALKAVYPTISTVLGDLDTSAVISEASAASDIVLHTANCDHTLSAKSIVSGLSSRSSPSYLIHTSGTGILPDISNTAGLGRPVPNTERYSDIDSIATLLSWDEKTHVHRGVDKIVLAAPDNVNTAIVCPPMIYGEGTGPGNNKSMQIPWLVAAILKNGKGFVLGEGQNSWNSVHVRDLAKVYLALTEAAVAGGKGADWNEQGYYFSEDGEFRWGAVSEKIVEYAAQKGWIQSKEIEHIDPEGITAHHPGGAILWGSNSIGKADRARKVLGWKPTHPSLWDELPATIEIEAKLLGG